MFLFCSLRRISPQLLSSTKRQNQNMYTTTTKDEKNWLIGATTKEDKRNKLEMLFALPDWSFSNGEQAPLRKSVLKVQRAKERDQERIERYQKEMDQLIDEKVAQNK
mmetsp:Transcript_17938/g.26707  ORF Transcript_17938/g.26707 Transcript_17938/m.26707 type:complete len:107 (-) Transcript_17938:1165-1485(-)